MVTAASHRKAFTVSDIWSVGSVSAQSCSDFTVNHVILLSMLSELEMSGKAHGWFESYLIGHSFNVSWQGQVSKYQHLSTGLPQGSVLGHLPFSIYITSLGDVIHSHGFSCHCYAVDTQL